MKNTEATSIVQDFMNEYVAWGGPIITRKMAYDDCIASGMSRQQADYCAFGRKSVPARTRKPTSTSSDAFRLSTSYDKDAGGTEMTTIKGQGGVELAVIGKIRRHRFEGTNPIHCAKCGRAFSAIGHK